MKKVKKFIDTMFKNKYKNFKTIAKELEQEADSLRDQLNCFKQECIKLQAKYDMLRDLLTEEQLEKESMLEQLVIKKEEVKDLKKELKETKE